MADRLYQLPLGLVGVAIGVALLPRLSPPLHTDDKADAQAAMDQAIVFVHGPDPAGGGGPDLPCPSS